MDNPASVCEKHEDKKGNTATSVDDVEREAVNICLRTVVADLIIQIHGNMPCNRRVYFSW